MEQRKGDRGKKRDIFKRRDYIVEDKTDKRKKGGGRKSKKAALVRQQSSVCHRANRK